MAGWHGGWLAEQKSSKGGALTYQSRSGLAETPFRQVGFDIMYGEGISKVGEMVDLGVQSGLVEKSGAWFSCDGQRIGQGRENAKQFMKDNPAVAAKLEDSIRKKSGVVADAMLAGPEGDEDTEAGLDPIEDDVVAPTTKSKKSA